MTSFDTIAAPATAEGRGALAIVRIDGPESAAILRTLCQSGDPEERRAVLVDLWKDGEKFEQAVAIRYAAPRSFTGNDLVELILHGSPVIVRAVLQAACSLGARLAEPGEFTERAVLNGKIDLVQAESIAGLVEARTNLQARLSLRNLQGMLSATAETLRLRLLHLISRLEAALDFSEEGYQFITSSEATDQISEALREVERLSDTFRRGSATRRGLSAVILGQPNAGKSTLLNRLVGSERAIVTAIPGTTRDIVQETIEVGGLPLTLSDTAGLRESSDEVEAIGIRRARAAAQSADLILYLIDSARGADSADAAELQAIGEQPHLVLYTKSDLRQDGAGLRISAQTGAGIDQLLARLDSMVRDRFAAPEGTPALVNQRQLEAVAGCAAALRAALEALAQGAEEQIVVVDLRRAAGALASLTGAVTSEDVLREIFAKFCIGK